MDTKSTIDDHPLVIELLKERYQKAEKEIYRVVEEFNLIMYEKPDKTVSAVFCSYFENLLEVLKSKNLYIYVFVFSELNDLQPSKLWSKRNFCKKV